MVRPLEGAAIIVEVLSRSSTPAVRNPRTRHRKMKTRATMKREVKRRRTLTERMMWRILVTIATRTMRRVEVATTESSRSIWRAAYGR